MTAPAATAAPAEMTPPSRRSILAGGVGAAVAGLGIGNPHPTGCSPRPGAGEPALLALDRSQGVALVLDDALAPVRVLRLPAPSSCCSLPDGGALVGAALTGELAGPHRILVLDGLGRVVGEVPPVSGLLQLALAARAEPFAGASTPRPGRSTTVAAPCAHGEARLRAGPGAARWSGPDQWPGLQVGGRVVWALAERGGTEWLYRLTPRGWQVVRGGVHGTAWLGPRGPLLGEALVPLGRGDRALPLGPGDRVQHLSWARARGGSLEPTALVRRERVPPRIGGSVQRPGSVLPSTPERAAEEIVLRASGPPADVQGARWVITGEDPASRRRAPPWWEVVARSAGVLYGASAAGDRIGATLLGSESVQGRWREQLTRTRGRTVQLLPWGDGVLLATRTALLAYDDLLLPRGHQGGLDHLVGCCRIGAPRT